MIGKDLFYSVMLVGENRAFFPGIYLLLCWLSMFGSDK